MNLNDIKELTKIVCDNNIESIEVISPELTVKIKMPTVSNNNVIPVSTNATITIPQANCDCDTKQIYSPMVGTFYLASSPETAPFVTNGKKVKKGDTLCIIEAMKLMNEIEAECDCEITEVLINDGDLVEFAQPLFNMRCV